MNEPMSITEKLNRMFERIRELEEALNKSLQLAQMDDDEVGDGVVFDEEMAKLRQILERGL